MNRFIDVDPGLCIGCRTCEIACALAHTTDLAAVDVGFTTPVVGAASEVFAFLGQAPRLNVIKTDTACMPVTCHHCDDAPCGAVCPNGAITQVQGTVQVNQDRCIGCKSCMLACPYGMMEIITMPATRPFAGLRWSAGTRALAHKCDLCIDRAQGPACVGACPTHALSVFTPPDGRSAIEQRRLQTMQEKVASVAAL